MSEPDPHLDPAVVVAQTLGEIVALARKTEGEARERLLDQADTILGAMIDLLPEHRPTRRW